MTSTRSFDVPGLLQPSAGTKKLVIPAINSHAIMRLSSHDSVSNKKLLTNRKPKQGLVDKTNGTLGEIWSNMGVASVEEAHHKVSPTAEPTSSEVMQSLAEAPALRGSAVDVGNQNSLPDQLQIVDELIFPDPPPSDEESLWKISDNDLNLERPANELPEVVFGVFDSFGNIDTSASPSSAEFFLQSLLQGDEPTEEVQLPSNVNPVSSSDVQSLPGEIDPELAELLAFENSEEISDETLQKLFQNLDQTGTAVPDVNYDQILEAAMFEAFPDLLVTAGTPAVQDTVAAAVAPAPGVASDAAVVSPVVVDPQPIKRGRGRPRLVRDTSASVSTSPKRRGRPPLACNNVPLPPIVGNISPEERYRRERDLNNEASRRCRMNRKRKMDDANVELAKLEAKNQQLADVYTSKLAEFNNMKSRVLACHACSKRLPEDYAANVCFYQI